MHSGEIQRATLQLTETAVPRFLAVLSSAGCWEYWQHLGGRGGISLICRVFMNFLAVLPPTHHIAWFSGILGRVCVCPNTL